MQRLIYGNLEAPQIIMNQIRFCKYYIEIILFNLVRNSLTSSSFDWLNRDPHTTYTDIAWRQEAMREVGQSIFRGKV